MMSSMFGYDTLFKYKYKFLAICVNIYQLHYIKTNSILTSYNYRLIFNGLCLANSYFKLLKFRLWQNSVYNRLFIVKGLKYDKLVALNPQTIPDSSRLNESDMLKKKWRTEKN